MKYNLRFDEPNKQQIGVSAIFQGISGPDLEIRLPIWRPGRYERSDSISLLSNVKATDQDGKTLQIHKNSSHSWLVKTGGASEVKFEYDFYANRLDAGSSYFDKELIYINGINLFVFDPNQIDAEIEVEAQIPSAFKLACSMSFEGGKFRASDYHELADSPILAAPNLEVLQLETDGVKANIWTLGEHALDKQKVTEDFTAFVSEQVKMFGGCPVEDYHFLNIIPATPFYHGVEHQASTVIVLGPGIKLHEPEVYKEFLGISSHEFFHTWNVKFIRPADLLPYDYSNEVYSKLHYVTEGITSYYGDLILLRAGVWNVDEWQNVFNTSNLSRFFRGEGWKYMSLEEASIESWNSGYREGVRNRKVSFYSKGAVVSFMLDQLIRRESGQKNSLDDVMRGLFHDFAHAGKGYKGEDIRMLCAEAAGVDLADFFDRFVSGREDIIEELGTSAEFVGMKIERGGFDQFSLSRWGFQTREKTDTNGVLFVWEGSPAEEAGLRKDDYIMSVNDVKVDGNLQDLLKHYEEESQIELNCISRGFVRRVVLPNDNEWRAWYPKLVVNEEASESQLANREAWSKSSPKHAVI